MNIVTNQEQAHTIASAITEVIGGSPHFVRTWSIRYAPSWGEVPVRKWALPENPNPVHLTEDQIEWLSSAARCTGYDSCLAVPIQPGTDNEKVYQVEMTQEDLYEFSRMCARSNYLLIPEDTAFAVLCSVDGYCVISGPYDFVCMSIGGYSPIEARAEFMEFARDPYSPAPQELVAKLTFVAKRYGSYTMAFYPVDASDVIEHMKAAAVQITDGQQNFSSAWLHAHRWAAVPVDKFHHDPGYKWLVDALRLRGYDHILAIRLYEDGEPKCYRIPVTKEGLLTFHNQYNMLDFLLFPEDMSCAILSADEYHNIIAGPHDFVVHALGMSIPTARKLFVNRYAVLEDEIGEKYMLETARRYEMFNGD